MGVASRADAWIETAEMFEGIEGMTSRPARTRGLKLPVMFDVQCSRVASRADAWIETDRIFTIDFGSLSRPARTRGLKHMTGAPFLRVWGRVPRGRVD